MKCADFLARFSEFYDSDTDSHGRAPFERHVASCPSCARYLEVVRKGVDLLREMPAFAPPEDFRERLRYSIYRVDDERRRGRNAVGASPVMLLAAAAVVLTMVVGAPRVWERDPSVELTPIVVVGPSEAPSPATPEPTLLTFAPAPRTGGAAWLESSDLWVGSNVLLYESSPLYQRHREPGLVRTGLR